MICPHCKEVVLEGKKYPNILEQSKYKGEYEKIGIENPDDFK